jgi:hypothetical protein
MIDQAFSVGSGKGKDREEGSTGMPRDKPDVLAATPAGLCRTSAWCVGSSSVETLVVDEADSFVWIFKRYC